jgi:23S rRNA (cytidine1920-2'-O)/16S rRNA (cytidine1409-2'-O)-methyltransferase
MDSGKADTGTLRLDQLLVARGLFPTRSRARDAILRGAVKVDGRPAEKAGEPVAAGCVIAIDDPAQSYVSRAALKLIAGLDRFGLDPAGAIALDIGASTGGFTQVLIERGAARVFAVDVGHGQLDRTIRDDPRVVVREGLNARDLTMAHMEGQRPSFVVCDASFISLRLVLPAALSLAAPGAAGLFLVKPQFEAGRAALGKGGILRDPAMGEAILRDLALWLDSREGWRVIGSCPSPVAGGDGNREYLLAGRKDR